MILRPARETDAAALCAVANPIIRDTVVTFTTTERREDEMAESIRAAQGAFFVAEVGGSVEGYATCFEFRKGPGYARTREHTILLAPSLRGAGAGRALMGMLEDFARGQGVHVLVGGVSGSNPAGRAFHAAIGFAETGVMPEVGFKFGRWHDLVLMQKIL